MLALEKDFDRCARPNAACKSQLRRARAGQTSLTRRMRLGLEALPPAEGSSRRLARPMAEPSSGAVELYLREVGRVRPLTAKAEHALARRAQLGHSAAREQLLKSNLPLVVSIAMEYEGIALPLLDLIAEGNVGLLKAIIRFDPAGKDAFSTRASWWIRQSIKRALAEYARAARPV